MTWSKTQTSSAPFVDGGYPGGSYYDGLSENKVVLGEFITWLGTRGWTITDSDTVASANGQVWWKIKKVVNVEGGGTRTYALYLAYTGSNTTSDRLEFYPTSNDGSVIHTSVDLIDVTWGMEPLFGTWTFWESDLDGDSFFIMNQDKNQIIGFWPPSGSIFSTTSYTTTWPRAVYPKPLFVSRPIASHGSDDTALYLAYGRSASGSNYYSNPVPMKNDYVWCTDSGRYPLFVINNGGEVSSLVYLNASAEVCDNVSSTTESKAGVAFIEDEFYITWGGSDSQLLFNVGANPPVF